MSNIRALKDAKIFIGPAQASDLDQAGYEALTFVQIKPVGSIGEFSAKESIVAYSPLEGADLKAKGNVNAGDPKVEYAFDHADVGQIALRAAGATKFSYAIKIELADAPSATETNTIFYTRGKVERPQQVGGGGDDIIKEMTTLALEQVAVQVAPATIV